MSPMNHLRRSLVALATLAVTVTLAAASTGCAITSHPSRPSAVGVPRSSDALAAVVDEPGPVVVETVASADWAVARSGLVNLNRQAAKDAHLTSGNEPIQVYFHALHHPTKGLFIIDTGAERAFRDQRDKAAINGFVAWYLDMGTMKVTVPLGDWLARQPDPLRGVLMTHLHPDHISGMADVPAGTPVFTGPGEADARDIRYYALQPTTDRALAGKPPIDEWRFQPDPAGRFAGIVDVFGDGTVWALWTPGHTPGSTSYVVRSPEGPVLFTGDTSHTVWGWEHDVEPGTLTADHDLNAKSLGQLRAFVAAHPKIQVRLGHQPSGGAHAAL